MVDNPASDNKKGTGIILQVLISAFGKAGIESVATHSHPTVPEVEYIVAWQMDNASIKDIPAVLIERDDFIIIPTQTKGLSVNRNIALEAATAPISLCSDDDVEYSEENLLMIIRSYRQRPDADFIAFEYFSSSAPRPYPNFEFNLKRPPKGYFIGGPEISFRTYSVKNAGIRFNEFFGVGCEFPSGEDDMFLQDCLDAGLNCIFIPEIITTHESDSTGMRSYGTPLYIRTKGAVMLRCHPTTWAIRMILHSLREIKPFSLSGALKYCRNWIKGVHDVRRLKAF